MMNGKKMKLPKGIEQYSSFLIVGALVLLFLCMRNKGIVEGYVCKGHDAGDNDVCDKMYTKDGKDACESDAEMCVWHTKDDDTPPAGGDASKAKPSKAPCKTAGDLWKIMTNMARKENCGPGSVDDNDGKMPDTCGQGDCDKEVAELLECDAYKTMRGANAVDVDTDGKHNMWATYNERCNKKK